MNQVEYSGQLWEPMQWRSGEPNEAAVTAAIKLRLSREKYEIDPETGAIILPNGAMVRPGDWILFRSQVKPVAVRAEEFLTIAGCLA